MNTVLSNSWLNGTYDNVAGYLVNIHSGLGFAIFESRTEDEVYDFQDNHADVVISEIADLWKNGDMTQEEAIAEWITMHL